MVKTAGMRFAGLQAAVARHIPTLERLARQVSVDGKEDKVFAPMVRDLKANL
jgi:hypothetical protein